MLFSFSSSKVSLQVALLVTFLNDYALAGLQPAGLEWIVGR